MTSWFAGPTRPWRRPSAAVGLAAALGVATARCGGDGATGPADFAGTYVVTHVNDRPLPARIFRSSTGNVTIVVLADTITESCCSAQYAFGRHSSRVTLEPTAAVYVAAAL